MILPTNQVSVLQGGLFTKFRDVIMGITHPDDMPVEPPPQVRVEIFDEKAINSADPPSQRTNPTKHANVRWADIVKCG